MRSLTTDGEAAMEKNLTTWPLELVPPAMVEYLPRL
jgi:hypothetical protein